MPRSGPRFRVGLTGGIGCGKSTVARAFAALGVPVLDADEIARELVQPGGQAADAVAAAFGPDVFRDGRLDRSALRELIFRDDAKRAALEAILHPLVYAELAARLARLSGPYGMLCVPLLLETAPRDFVDRILVVDCAVATQVQRVIRRDGSSAATVRRIIARQASREERLRAADDVLDNDGDPGLLERRIAALHAAYLALAGTMNAVPEAIGPSCGTID